MCDDEKIALFGQYLADKYTSVQERINYESLHCDDSPWSSNTDYRCAQANKTLITEIIKDFEQTFGKIILLD